GTCTMSPTAPQDDQTPPTFLDAWLDYDCRKIPETMADRYRDWRSIRNRACELFGHSAFTAETFERLRDWVVDRLGPMTQVPLSTVAAALGEAIDLDEAAHARYASLLQFAGERLKGIQRRVLELVCEGDGQCRLADLAADPQIKWHAPYDNQFNKAA